MATTATFADFKDILVKQDGDNSTPLDLMMMTFFGAPGSGKTTVAAAFTNHLYLDLEASATTHEIDALDIKTWAKFRDWVTVIHENASSPWDGKTLVIDTVTELWDMCVRHGLAERKMKVMPDDYQRTRNAIRDDFKQVMQMLLNLRMKRRLGCILIAHEGSREVKDGAVTKHEHEPECGDKVVNAWVAAKPQIVIRFTRESYDPISGKKFDGVRWIMRTKPLAATDCVKDRTNRLPKFLPAKYSALETAYEDGGK